MAEQPKSPFARVQNGYDPKQVAAFAAEALSWKRELAALRSEVAAAAKLVERYESVMGSIDEVEREAAEIVEQAEHRSAGLIEEAEKRAAEIVEEAEDQAAKILEMARDQIAGTPLPEPEERRPPEGDGWLNPEPTPQEMPDPVEQIFDPVEDDEPIDPEDERERRVAAAAANLWKRRGVLAPPE